MPMPLKREKLPELGGVGGISGDEITRGLLPDAPNQRRMDIISDAEGIEVETIPEKKKKKKKKKPVKKNIGGMMRYGHGGKVRGAGKAVKGVRPAKMVSMKGS